jgi:hypothetical protein
LDHDFPSDADGLAIPHGVYDVTANLGTVFIGTGHDTPHFAADNLARWWRWEGRRRYPRATEILVLADSGGSNGARCNVFKYALQYRLANPYRLSVTVCHYPTGASKWNPIDHRLFSEISKNWAGCPLRTYETILNHIRTTRTETGLRVRAHLITKDYATGVRLSKDQLATLNLIRHDFQPVRNYTIHPR